jgi:histidinol-phosphatase (PHP family)
LQAPVFDCHCHSTYSSDGQSTIGELAAHAFANGVSGFCVTDHCDLNEPYAETFPAIAPLIHAEILNLRKKWDGKISILSGIELGNVTGFERQACAVLAAADFDYVLLSLHRATGFSDLYETDFSGFGESDVHRLARAYFEDAAHCAAKWDNYDAFAHLTLPARYIRQRLGVVLDLRRYSNELEATLKALAERGKALEINVSGLRTNIHSKGIPAHGDTMPSPWLVKRFRELGGEIITLGSDAHHGQAVGSHLRDGAQIAHTAGFRHAAYYKERKPVFYPIE